MDNLSNISVIKDVLARHNFTFSKALGQNFLVNPSVCPKIAEMGNAKKGFGIIEIGTGIGVLTNELAKRADKVVAIEIDDRLMPVLAETLAEYDNVKIINADVMETDLHKLIAEEFQGMDVAVCANLPYYITSPILMMLLEERLPIKSVTVMVQKEAGTRLCAPMGTRDMGAVTVAINYFSVPKLLFNVSRGSFMPSPNVDSCVVRFDIRDKTPEGVTDEKDIDSIDILARTGTDRFTQNGSNEDWLELADFCKKKDLNDPENLQYVTDRLDVDSLFTHAAYEIILGNVDFTNVRVYRVPGGKWKYLLFDVEACWRNLDKTPLEYYIKPVTAKIQGFRHEPLNALLAVPEMKAKFLTRVAEILEKHFQWPDVEAHFNEVIDVLEPILPRHIARWKNMKLSNWQKNISATEYYARVRPKKIPEMLQKAMKLTDEEVETYFGEVLRLLEETNTKK